MGSQLLQNMKIIKQTDVGMYYFGKFEEYMDLSRIYLAVCTYKFSYYIKTF